jgi:hypothetical protein
VNIELVLHFALISFWFDFAGDIVAIKAENDPRSCACQGIVAMIQYSFQFVASKMAEKSISATRTTM